METTPASTTERSAPDTDIVNEYEAAISRLATALADVLSAANATIEHSASANSDAGVADQPPPQPLSLMGVPLLPPPPAVALPPSRDEIAAFYQGLERTLGPQRMSRVRELSNRNRDADELLHAREQVLDVLTRNGLTRTEAEYVPIKLIVTYARM